MGNCLLLLGLKKEKRPVTLLLVGLDSAGKTTAAKGIVGDPVEDVAPTVGFAPECLEYRGCEVTIYDLGGGAKIRPVWTKYFSEVHGVIYVVDSAAGGRLGECQEVLTALLAHPKIAGKPVLILANKQDIEGAMDEIDLVEGLKVEEIVNRYKCPTRVETCSAVATRNRKPDKPIADGFRWLVDTIVVHYKEINKRVTKDMEREREEQRRELEERKERLRHIRAQREAMSAGSGGRRSEGLPPHKLSSPSSSSSSSSSSVVTKAEVVRRKEEEEEEVEEKRLSSPSSAAASKIPNGSLPQDTTTAATTTATTTTTNTATTTTTTTATTTATTNHRTTQEQQELRELGFQSSGELGGPVSSSSSPSPSPSSSSRAKDTAPSSPPASSPPQPPTSPPAPHRVILVRESSPPHQHHGHGTTTTTTTATTTTTTTTTTRSPSPSSTSLASGGHNTSRLDLSSERRQSECIPIDSDDEMFDLPAAPSASPPPHHHHHSYHNYLHHHSDATHLPPSSTSPGSSAKELELEGVTKAAKKKSFLKRYHKTAPLVTRDQEVPPQQA